MIKRIISLAVVVPLTIIAMLIVAVWVIGSSIEYISQPSQAASSRIVLPPTSNQVEAEINQWRTSQGLAAFNSDVPALDEAAQARAEGMCAENDWSHDKAWQVLDPYYGYTFAGENLYYGSLRPDQVDDAVNSWVASPTHLENLKSAFTQIGVGVKACPGFQDRPSAVIITNYFGVPR